jgi:phospholipid/cholesterol/gamma-HCH transport system substrate-binding protein
MGFQIRKSIFDMNTGRTELKVGMFVLTGLTLLAVLALLLSKSTNIFASTTELRLKSASVGAIKNGANILMAGVSVGRVSGVELGAEGTNVIIHLKVLAKYKIYEDARFAIEQAGFLGDQYVAIYPARNHGRILISGDEVVCNNPFNLQETVGKAAETIARIGEATTNVDAAVTDVRQFVLTGDRLSRLGSAIDHFEKLAMEAHVAISNLNALVLTNRSPVTAAVSNLNAFATELVPLATRLTGLVTNNEDGIAIAIKNVEIASAGLTNLMNELQNGRGTAGRLVYDEQLGAELAAIAQNLSMTTSNLNRGGLWSILWKKKEPRTNSASRR